MSSRSWKVVIPAPAPWLNANGRRDRRTLATTVRAWRDAAHQYAQAAKLPGLGRAHITATLRFPDRRRRDCPNYYPTIKAAIDGLVDAGVLPDDSDRQVTGLEIKPGEPLLRKKYGPVGELVLTIREVT